MKVEARLTLVFSRLDPERDIPWRRRQFETNRIEEDCSLNVIPLAQTQRKMLFLEPTRRPNALDTA